MDTWKLLMDSWKAVVFSDTWAKWPKEVSETMLKTRTTICTPNTLGTFNIIVWNTGRGSNWYGPGNIRRYMTDRLQLRMHIEIWDFARMKISRNIWLVNFNRVISYSSLIVNAYMTSRFHIRTEPKISQDIWLVSFNIGNAYWYI